MIPPSAYKKKKKKRENDDNDAKKEKILDDGDDDLETPFLKIDKCQRQQKEEPLFKTIALVFNTHMARDNEFWNVTQRVPHVVTVKCDLHSSISNRH